MIVRDSSGDIDVNLLEIRDVINIDLLQLFQNNFAESLNIASVTVDKNGTPVTTPSSYTNFCTNYIHSTAIGDCRCAESHRKGGERAACLGRPYIYTCHAKLIDFAAPILIGDTQIGTILGGQVLTKTPELHEYRNIAKEIGVDEDNLVKAVKKIKIMEEKNVKAAAEVLFVIANALSKIGYEEIRLKNISQNLRIEILKKDLLLKESEEYNKLKTQLFSTISHELKTPLNIIFSSLQLMESLYSAGKISSENNVFYKYCSVMKQNCYRLLRLINNLIDMNKIELGFFKLNLTNNNIVSVIEELALSVSEYARLKNIELIFDTETEEKIIAFDPEKFERIILNLLSNAIKFTNNGGKIYVNIYEDCEYVFISIRDTGCGIPKDMLEKIFDAFTQVDTTLRRNAEGSGIGLSLVKSLVEMHGGEITVKSTLGLGSEFIIKIPSRLVEDKTPINSVESQFLEENIKMEFSDIYL